jgi:tetratricopeptide (TPR) repeat protein
LAINEYSDEAFYGKGLYLQQQEKYEDALKHYEKARSINQGHMLAAYNIAVIYNLFEEYSKAAEMCNKVLDLDENSDKAYALRGFTYEKRNNKTAAIADYKSALKINPKNAQALSGLEILGSKI